MNDEKLPMAVGKANQDLGVVSKPEHGQMFSKVLLGENFLFFVS